VKEPTEPIGRFRAVIFDLGGVVLGSPLHMIAEYERDAGIPPGTINRVVMEAGLDGAWSRYERGELAADDFVPAFEVECRVAGAEVDATLILRRIDEVTRPRPEMYQAIERIREHGLATAALTNNFAPLQAPDLTARFDVVVQSSVEGFRKPQKRIYEIVVERLGIEAKEAVFLDDIGANLKPARAMGMATIKVDDPHEAIVWLSELLGLDLVSAQRP